MLKWEGIARKYNKEINKLLKAPKLYFSKCAIKDVPESRGIYFIYKKEHSRKPIYIGMSNNLRRRIMGQHLRANSRFAIYCKRNTGLRKTKSLSRYIKKNCFFRFMPYSSEGDYKELELLEHFAIAIIRPKWMVRK